MFRVVVQSASFFVENKMVVLRWIFRDNIHMCKWTELCYYLLAKLHVFVQVDIILVTAVVRPHLAIKLNFEQQVIIQLMHLSLRIINFTFYIDLNITDQGIYRMNYW